jgi:hypothetical protein
MKLYSTSRAVAVAAIALGASALPAALPIAGAAQTRAHPAINCAGLPWTYHVGPRVLPMGAPRTPQGAVPSAQPTPKPGTGHASTGTAIAWPASILRGTMTISGYGGCGGAATTSGTFAVQRVPLGPPIERSQSSGGTGTIACAVPCYGLPGIVAARGAFRQDPLHPGDATYVQVSATITSTRPGPQMGRPCAPNTGCPPGVMIRSTVHVSDVTGYLQVSEDSQSATLSFLPPPAVYQNAAPAALILEGWRGTAAPATVPKP